MVFSGAEADDAARRLVDEHGDTLGLADHRADESEAGAVGFGRRRRPR